jgi:uncharacterized protein YndB with AHSA1/START domain
MTDFLSTVEVDIDVPRDRVWNALVDPTIIKKYMFGTEVESSWGPGSPIFWRGEFKGQHYEDHGEVLDVKPYERLKVSHFSPMSGLDDVPENYHTVTYELQQRGTKTHLCLTQGGNHSQQEADNSTENWQMALHSLVEAIT